LLINYQVLGRKELAGASVLLNTGFEMIRWLTEVDSEVLKFRLLILFGYNRSSLFKINAAMDMSKNTNDILDFQRSPLHSSIKTIERKIVVTLREIASIDIDIACGCCALSYEDAYVLRNTELDLVEDWVYEKRSSAVLGLRFRNHNDAKKLLNMNSVSVASKFLDQVAY
jgi:hypothetical protein